MVTDFATQFAVLYRQEVEAMMQALQSEFREELKAQGHVDTGKLSDSITYSIELVSTAIIATMYMEDYGVPVDTGVSAANIPYRGRTGAATSKYIQGLIGYFQRKGLAEIEAKRAAFATANKHKQEGMPTRNSFVYSQNGRRTNFVDATISNNIDRLFETIEKGLGDGYEVQFNDFIKRVSTEIK